MHVLSLIISQSFVALWFLLGVEDTIGVQQQKTKGQKKRENNGLVRRCSIAMCPVLTSSTPRSLHKQFYQGNNFYSYLFIIIIKIVTSVKLSPIFLVFVLSILAWKFGKSHTFPTASIVAWSFSGTQPICCSPASVRENTPYHFANHVIRSFVRRLPFLSSQQLFWLQKTLTSHL